MFRWWTIIPPLAGAGAGAEVSSGWAAGAEAGAGVSDMFSLRISAVGVYELLGLLYQVNPVGGKEVTVGDAVMSDRPLIIEL